MAKDPAFLFYYQDFLVGTDDFTNDQVGAYIRCLCIQAAKGGISLNHMIKICESQQIQNVIKNKFVWYPEEGVFRNDRLSEEIEKRKKYCESRGKNKKGKKHMKVISESYDEHMEDENENTINRVLNTNTEVNVEVKVIGTDLAIDTARLVWNDQGWREQSCMAHAMPEDDLKRWMAQFNASVSNDHIADFNAGKYKKLFGGWLNKQKGKGYKLEKNNNHSPQLRKLGS